MIGNSKKKKKTPSNQIFFLCVQPLGRVLAYPSLL